VIPFRTEPFPTEAVRDALGLARLLYAVHHARGGAYPLLSRIQAAGTVLADALAKGATSQPDTLTHASTWTAAENACGQLVRIEALSSDERTLVQAALARVKGVQRSAPAERS